MLELKDVQDAYKRIRPYIIHTPLLRVPTLDEFIGHRLLGQPC